MSYNVTATLVCDVCGFTEPTTYRKWADRSVEYPDDWRLLQVSEPNGTELFVDSYCCPDCAAAIDAVIAERKPVMDGDDE